MPFGTLAPWTPTRPVPAGPRAGPCAQRATPGDGSKVRESLCRLGWRRHPRGVDMRRCGIKHAIQAAIVTTFLVAYGPAIAGITLGASFGYTHLSSSIFSDHITNDVVGIPSTQDWTQPGLRVGYISSQGQWDLNADIGFFHRSGTLGLTNTAFEAMPLFQVNAFRRGACNAFVNGGVGVEHETGFASSATRPVLGGGLGVRRSVSDAHGFIRAELRYDYLPERERAVTSFTTDLYPATNLFSIKLGFDLLLTH